MMKYIFVGTFPRFREISCHNRIMIKRIVGNVNIFISNFFLLECENKNGLYI